MPENKNDLFDLAGSMLGELRGVKEDIKRVFFDKADSEARLKYLLEHRIESESGYFTFPDGTSMPCKRTVTGSVTVQPRARVTRAQVREWGSALLAVSADSRINTRVRQSVLDMHAWFSGTFGA